MRPASPTRIPHVTLLDELCKQTRALEIPVRHARLAADETEATEAKPLEPSTGSQRKAVVVTTLVVTPPRSAPRIRTKQALDTSHG